MDVLSIGETMALLVPAEAEPVETAEEFRVEVGGAESNLACRLAVEGRRVKWFSALGDDALGRRTQKRIEDFGVDTSLVRVDPSAPTGLYVKNPGVGVSYYRRGSAASQLGPADVDGIDWAEVRIVHLSGITLALSDSCRALVDVAIELAHAHGVLVSFDVNYRPALWENTAAAARAIRETAERADILWTGRDEAAALWKTEQADDVRALFPNAKHLIVKDADVEAVEFSPEGRTAIAAPRIEVVEPVGAGDAFAAGWLDALLSEVDSSDRLDRGHAFAAQILASTLDIPTGLVPDWVYPFSVYPYWARPFWRQTGSQLSESGGQEHGRDDTRKTTTGIDSGQQFTEIFSRTPAMAILRGMGVERSLEIAEIAWSLGIDAVEIPIQTATDKDALVAVIAAGKERGKQVGAGTVIDEATVRIAAEAGAAFTVSPGLDMEIVRASERAGMASMPGVATATEVQLALKNGLYWLKAFPASVLGTDWFTAMRGPFPGLNFVATGGIKASNTPSFLNAGVRVVALGSALADPEELARLSEILAR